MALTPQERQRRYRERKRAERDAADPLPPGRKRRRRSDALPPGEAAKRKRADALRRYYADHEASKDRQRLRARERRAKGLDFPRLREPKTIAARAAALRWNGLGDAGRDARLNELIRDSRDRELQLLAEVWFRGNAKTVPEKPAALNRLRGAISRRP